MITISPGDIVSTCSYEPRYIGENSKNTRNVFLSSPSMLNSRLKILPALMKTLENDAESTIVPSGTLALVLALEDEEGSLQYPDYDDRYSIFVLCHGMVGWIALYNVCYVAKALRHHD